MMDLLKQDEVNSFLEHYEKTEDPRVFKTHLNFDLLPPDVIEKAKVGMITTKFNL